MAKLYFYYSAMNAGKSTTLLQSSFNYQERGMDTLLFTPGIDNRYSTGSICSRIGLKAEAISFDYHFDFLNHLCKALHENNKIRCVLIDEAQFLKKNQVIQLTDIVDKLDVPVLAYGLRADFQGEPFEGSMYLLLLADNLIELKTICHCGRKATMNARVNAQGDITKDGAQIEIGGNDRYLAVCRKHFKKMWQSIPITPQDARI